MANRVIVAYGDSGTGKSEAALALYFWRLKKWREQAGLAPDAPPPIMRVYVGDGSAATYLDTGLVINPPDEPVNPEGLIELCYFNHYPWPLDVINQIAEGWFPESGVNGAPLVPPAKQASYARVRFWGYEGLQVIGEYLMGSHQLGGLAEQAARGIKIGPDAAIRVVSTEYEIDLNTGLPNLDRPKKNTGSGLAYGSNGTAHYMMGQTHMQGFVERTKALNGWVYLTTHERAAKDKAGFKKDGLGKDAQQYGNAPVIIGPSVIGDALTAGLQKSVNETLHFQVASKLVPVSAADAASGKKVAEVVREHRIYTGEHLDPDQEHALRYRALVRSGGANVKPYYTGSALEGTGIVQLYEDLEKDAKAKMLANMAKAGLRAKEAA